MNKKMYLEPEIEVLEIEVNGFLCASGGVSDDGGAAAELPSGTEPYVDPNDD